MSSKRQLAAIMFTDIVGYTALMGKDSQKALELVHISKEIQKPLVEKYSGKWLKEMGDGAMAQFDTALDAVNCAVDIQKSARAELDAKLRIGIHLGDVTIEGDDILGDGVNIASRLESIADPGGIYISEAIDKAIRGQSDIKTKFLGALELKNVDYELRTYSLEGVGMPFPSILSKHEKTELKTGPKLIGKFLGNRMIVGLIIVIVFLLPYLFYQAYQSSSNQIVQPAHLQVVLPPDTYLAVDTNYPTLALSPDGSTLAFVAVNKGERHLYLKKLDESSIEIVPGTEGALNPFFSTDGKWIAFFKGFMIMKVSTSGGLPVAVHIASPMGVNRGATWYNDSIISISSTNSAVQIGASSGESVHPSSDWRDIIRVEESQVWPSGIKEINSILLTEVKSGNAEDANIVLLSPTTGVRNNLINGGYFSQYSDAGYVLFIREGSLFSVPFNTNTKNISGNEKKLVSDVFSSVNWSGQYAVAGTTLAYIQGEGNSKGDQLVWVDREGNVENIFSNGTEISHPRLSKDGSRLAVSAFDGFNLDVWLYDMNRGTFERLTFHPGEDFGPVWSPDGKQLAISTEIAEDDGEDGPGMALLTIDSQDPPERMFLSPKLGYWEFPTSWSLDGTAILFTSTKGDPTGDIEIITVENGERQVVEEKTSSAEGGGSFSPHGKWIAYVSNYTGREEVYIKSFPASGAPKPVSVNGGNEPVWSRDGTELFYRENKKMMVVSIQYDSTISFKTPEVLFEGSALKNYLGQGISNYEISPDGKRFIMVRRLSQSKPTVINIVLNWPEVFK
jgi:Tol biopolymer transport system component